MARALRCATRDWVFVAVRGVTVLDVVRDVVASDVVRDVTTRPEFARVETLDFAAVGTAREIARLALRGLAADGWASGTTTVAVAVSVAASDSGVSSSEYSTVSS